MRLPSTDRLSKALLSASEAAVADVSKHLREAAGVAQDGDPLDAFFARLPEIEALMPLSVRQPSRIAEEVEANDG
jgi:hypothetical protein